MTKKKDLNDAAQEAAKTGKVVPLKLVDVDTDFFDVDYLGQMNQSHAFVNSLGGKPMVMSWVYNEVYEREIIEFVSPDAVIMRYSNQTVPGGRRGDTPTPLGKWWIGHTDRREYDTVTFEPKRDPGDFRLPNEKLYYNLWEGFTELPSKGDWTKTKKHLYRILSNGDRSKFIYIMHWLAWCVQNPGTRAEVAVVFKGKKGAGKGFIFTQMVKIFGRHGMSISNRDHLTGKHNSHLMMLSFLFADEAYYPGDKDIEGCLKQLITEPALTVEPKFQNTKLSLNCLHIGMSTNNEWVIPASDDERRFYINEVDSRLAKNQVPDAVRKKYFTELWGEMENGGRAAMLYDLLNMKLGDWHPRDDIPETEELQRQKDLSMTKVDKTVVAFIDEGIFPGKFFGEKRGYICKSQDLFDYMEKIDPGSHRISMKAKANVFKEVGCTTERMEGERVWKFPPLEELKSNWNKIKGRYEWSDFGGWALRRQEPIDTV